MHTAGSQKPLLWLQGQLRQREAHAMTTATQTHWYQLGVGGGIVGIPLEALDHPLVCLRKGAVTAKEEGGGSGGDAQRGW